MVKRCKKTENYIEETGAILINKDYRIISLDFDLKKARIQLISHYQKRNGKYLFVEDSSSFYVDIPDEMIKRGFKDIESETDDWCVGDREIFKYRVKNLYVNKKDKKKILNSFKENLTNRV